ncbi:hypothetical protein PBI_ATRAXA_7 [Arthrobacter phage Atraxa]|uniref:Tail terminator n=1 Tax=Arthrobacter phage Atraxa TaxID=2419947 RepID=A0A3G2KDB1_9CAUD|nr:hypothetical protein PP342_gp07 [Arthrobacter phage Atraxa]AYN56963.1 hypothetical protein PBI_ATRAXA_7 [Arthrobacter phage Atraxa]AYN59071.1 hypothetical protein PBI_SPUTNIK_7 [Arthrobacter phage Sputnik]
MAGNWADAARYIAESLETTGYNAKVNAQDLNIPGFWVTPATRTFDRLDASTATLTFDVYAVVSPMPNAEAALEELSDMQDALIGLGETQPELRGQGLDAEVTQVQLSNKTPEPLPALKITITVEDE